jgi:long-chain acyl-CoA synthetase
VSTYDDRPWLALYPEGWPQELEPEYEDALAFFAETVRRRGDEPALLYFDEAISYRRLDELTDAFAAGLRAQGVAPGDRVAIYLQNVPQWAIAMVGAWKAGTIAVAVNPMLKQRELEVLLNDCTASALVVLESLWRSVAKEVVPGTSVRVAITTSELDFLGAGPLPRVLEGSARDRDPATLDLVELVEAHRGERPPDPELGPDAVALLTYTSGTTGPPKGAMGTHRNVVFITQVYRELMGLTERDVIFGVAPLFHITGLIGHMTFAFLTGAPLVLAYRFDPETTLELLERHRVTFTVGAITVFIALMAHPDADRRDLSALRKVYSGGAPIAPAVVEAYERRFGVYIHNAYGMTETTSPSHAVPIGRRAPVDPRSGALSVGVPVFNTVVRVIDDAGDDVPVGEIGELVTEGPQVVPGYWEKPEENATAFRPNGGIKTGDVGFMDADGWFYVVDRKKDQINVSGYKVWPRDVEDVLYGHPAVREAAVVGAPDEYRGETVVAFVSLKADAAPSADELIAFCKERMAAYKYPRRIEFLDELPKTASGKILRRELRDRAPTTQRAPG